MAPLVASFACVVVRSLSPFIYLCQALKLTTTIHRRHLKMRCPLGSSSGVRRLLGDSCWRTGEAWRRLSCWQFVLRWPRGNERPMSTNPIICAKRNTSGTKVTVRAIFFFRHRFLIWRSMCRRGGLRSLCRCPRTRGLGVLRHGFFLPPVGERFVNSCFQCR